MNSGRPSALKITANIACILAALWMAVVVILSLYVTVLSAGFGLLTVGPIAAMCVASTVAAGVLNDKGALGLSLLFACLSVGIPIVAFVLMMSDLKSGT